MLRSSKPAARLALLWIFLSTSVTGHPADYPRVFRTFMPDSGPSAFAVELSPSVALCYDPLRGGINQVWTGGIDLSPTLRAKINSPAEPSGAAFYVEKQRHPLRLGKQSAEPEHRFKGYRYAEDAVIFEFTLDGVLVTETLRVSDDGKGLEREFNMAAEGGAAFFLLESQANAVVTVRGGTETQPGQWEFPGGSRFSIVIAPLTPSDS